MTVSLPDMATVAEEEGAIIELCAVITAVKAIESYIVIKLSSSDDTGSYYMYKFK